jgi:cobalamin biosynthesis Mg chelatase CobN
MLGSRHYPARGWDLSVFSLLSVLAVLASACFPVGASADSSGAEYTNEVPSVVGHHKPIVAGNGGGNEKANASNKGGGYPSEGGGGSGSGGPSAGGDAGTGSGQGADEDKGGNGSTNPQHENGGKDAAGNGDEQLALNQAGEVGEDNGGSSPLVPILIVIALLAAISIGVVVWQRRRSDSTVSPKAG